MSNGINDSMALYFASKTVQLEIAGIHVVRVAFVI
jgi:hypothetical protein